MEPIKFKEANCVFGKGQEQYKELPTFYDRNTEEGIVVSCYKLTLIERLRVLFKGNIWVGLMTFNKSLQPQILTTKKSDLLITKKQ